MIKRWLRRRLDVRMSHLEPSLDDNDRERGTLVRKGTRVALRSHVPANRDAFQRWYADPEIAELLRHDLEPLTPSQSRGYFDTFILPSSARGTCFAIHERQTKRLIGTTALTDRVSKPDGVSALFRIVIGEKDVWGQGYGTEATRLVANEAFDNMGLSEIRLEVFSHNTRAISAYTRVGFEVTGEHVEWVPRRKRELRVIEMRLSRGAYLASRGANTIGSAPRETFERSRDERKRRRDERERTRARRRTHRTSPPERMGTDKHQNEPGSSNEEAVQDLD
jgi:RimJ/RimL family protein N-acetyltransferase